MSRSVRRGKPRSPLLRIKRSILDRTATAGDAVGAASTRDIAILCLWLKMEVSTKQWRQKGEIWDGEMRTTCAVPYGCAKGDGKQNRGHGVVEDGLGESQGGNIGRHRCDGVANWGLSQ